MRPAHVHFIISADRCEPLTTHLFVAGDPYLESDAVFGVKDSLIVPFVRHDDLAEAALAGVPNPFYTAEEEKCRPTYHCVVEELRPDEFEVSGRGELHLSILLETMRREGYEVQVGAPRVIVRDVDGKKYEPFEHLVIDVPERFVSAVIGVLAGRKGKLIDVVPQGSRSRMEFEIPARALFGFRTQFLSMTQGEGIMSHVFDGYAPWAGDLKTRQNGSLVASEAGSAFAYSISKLQERGSFFITPATDVYVGMVVGENNRENDLNVNVCKNKKLTNVRSSGADDALNLTPVRKMTLEEALEYIGEDELVEITPKSIRLRKKVLEPGMRK